MDTIYIKVPQCIEVKHPNVTLGDFLTLYSTNTKLVTQLKSCSFYQFTPGKKQQIIVSILHVIQFIYDQVPDIDIDNLGEGDFILSYQPKDSLAGIKEGVSTLFICLIAFFGGGYAIMAYNTDVGAKELFTYLSMLFLGDARSGVLYIAIAYAIGLSGGMLLFFNHLGNKRFTSDPTPLEVQMRLYEKDVSTTIIKDKNRRGETLS